MFFIYLFFFKEIQSTILIDISNKSLDFNIVVHSLEYSFITSVYIIIKKFDADNLDKILDLFFEASKSKEESIKKLKRVLNIATMKGDFKLLEKCLSKSSIINVTQSLIEDLLILTLEHGQADSNIELFDK